MSKGFPKRACMCFPFFQDDVLANSYLHTRNLPRSVGKAWPVVAASYVLCEDTNISKAGAGTLTCAICG
jgi:hypothetical protein